MLKNKILSNNNVIQLNTIYLLEHLMESCGLTFRTQIGGKDFMHSFMKMIKINKDKNKNYYEMIKLIKIWKLK
jgi:hypothetical protein